MKLARFTKQPLERKRYAVDYSEWLDTGETISTRSFSVAPTTSAPLVIDASSISDDGKTVVFFVNGGNNSTTYTVTIVITTSGGQTKEDEIVFSVRET